MPRKYTAESKAYDASQARHEARAARNRAHRMWEAAHGPVPDGYQVDHKIPISQGGKTEMSNLRMLKAGTNASFDRAGPGGKQLGAAGKGKTPAKPAAKKPVDKCGKGGKKC